MCPRQPDFRGMEQEQYSSAAQLQRQMVLQVAVSGNRQAQSTFGVQGLDPRWRRIFLQLRVRMNMRYCNLFGGLNTVSCFTPSYGSDVCVYGIRDGLADSVYADPTYCASVSPP